MRLAGQDGSFGVSLEQVPGTQLVVNELSCNGLFITPVALSVLKRRRLVRDGLLQLVQVDRSHHPRVGHDSAVLVVLSAWVDHHGDRMDAWVLLLIPADATAELIEILLRDEVGRAARLQLGNRVPVSSERPQVVRSRAKHPLWPSAGEA